MKIVIDTNVLISTLLSSNGIVGTFLLKELQDSETYSCYYLYTEVFDKKEKILKYSGLTEDELLELLYIALKKIQFINESQFSKSSWEKAKELAHDIDIDDVSFVALAIEIDAILWTGDKKLYRGLRDKGFKNIVNLEDLRQLLKRDKFDFS